jgi:hypothetical protein
MTIALTFEDAEVLPNANGGRNKDPNPYADVVASIALKRNDKNKPVAKKFVLTSENADAVKTDIARARRQLAEAGKANDPAVTVQVREAEVDGQPLQTLITFWTIPPIVRGKDKAEAKAEEKTEIKAK